MSVRDEILAANEQYAASFEKGDLPMPPGRQFAVVTWMDARLDPAKFLGLDEGDTHVIRNAGGLVTDDAMRSLIISRHLLGTQESTRQKRPVSPVSPIPKGTRVARGVPPAA